MSPVFQPLAIPNVLLVRHERFTDARGAFTEGYRRSAFEEAGILEPFVQANFTRSVGGVLRGLHYQHPPVAQGKLIHVVCGEIFDVAVDLRIGSLTFGKWVAQHLLADKPESLYIPPGFAHGYCTMSAKANVIYWVTAEYSPENEAGILWKDEQLGIRWPIRNPTVSGRDARLPSLRTADIRFFYVSSDQESDARAEEIP